MLGIDARRTIVGLSLLGAADSIYMLSYHLGLIGSLVCPFFGEGCNRVGRSSHARHFGVPNAAVGAAGYGAMAVLAAMSGGQKGRRWSAPLLAATSLSAFGASVFLTWEQPFRVGAWCFWCLSSAAINLAILPLALRGAARKGDRL
ncbi:MAG TPA: vitamin K epoxide reductase family protein [Chloroflexota bacterium]|nr:vitamin K epoxide reductase family protein [Chloroflexota bacterium]